MFQRFRRHYQALKPPSRRGFWSGLVFTTAMLLFSVAVLPELLQAKQFREILANGIPLALGIFSALSTMFFWLNRTRMGGWTIILVVLLVLLVVPVVAERVGFLVAILAFGVSSFIAGQVFSDRESAIVAILAAFVSAAI